MIELYNSHNYFDVMQVRMISFLPRYFPAAWEHLEKSPGGSKWSTVEDLVFLPIKVVKNKNMCARLEIERQFINEIMA